MSYLDKYPKEFWDDWTERIKRDNKPWLHLLFKQEKPKNKNMKTIGYFASAVAALVIFFFCIWAFNHIDPWVGIFSTILFIGVSISIIIKHFNVPLK